MAYHDPDDLDRLLLETTPRPPADLPTRVLRRAALERRRGRLIAALALDTTAILTLAILAALLGRAAAGSGLAELLALAMQDHALLREHPAEMAWALALAAPWPHVLAITADLLVITLLTGYLLRAASPAPPTGERQ
ncbi:MAG: hypothetical protein C4290_14085 [Chloroflexota bacterium]